MDVQPEQAAGQSEYQGQTYSFCCDVCEKAFDQEPATYARPRSATAGMS
jgi:YHS domain-containing protein